MAVQITASGIGQTLMIGGVVLGVVMAIDSILFMTEEPSIMEKVNVLLLLNDKVRGVIELGLGIMLVMFGLGLWTVQVGGLAIIALLVITFGTHWVYTDSKGTANQQTTNASTQQARSSNRFYCPLNKKQSDWCNEDDDSDGVLNRYDSDFNERGQGIRNCKYQNYITSENGPGCKPVTQ